MTGMTGRFACFVAIDWSGAAGERHRGIAIAMAWATGGAPQLVANSRPWSRLEVLDWLLNDLPRDALVGLDLGFALPFLDCGAYFPGWDRSPPNARALWQLVDELSAADPHLGVTGVVEHPKLARYFRHRGREGASFHSPRATHRRGRFRVTEEAQGQNKLRPTSNFNLVGAAQVGKASLTGMRVLHRLGGRIPVWPIDAVPRAGSVIVEIYTTLAAVAAGRTVSTSKMRSVEALNQALYRLGSAPIIGSGPIDDHSADALITASWLRAKAECADLWSPARLDRMIARTEGWTFGVR